MPVVFKLLFLGFMLYAVLNILLTIIVSLDMARNGRFNGLWIPVLLIAGIPGSIIYALFRIGEKMPCKSI
jgi:ABC-type multidrug transport system permease subunit